jgi:4-hydroxy-tetrahydrodipicolinate synthase
MFIGSIPALVTPMRQDGSIARNEFINLIKWHLNTNSAALVIGGTTGEAASLSDAELYQLIHDAVITAKDNIPIIASTGCSSTAHTITRTQQAARLGAQAALVITPYYNRPTATGLYQHYINVAHNSTIPIILYNVPSRTACDLSTTNVIKLAQIAQIIGIKESSNDSEKVKTIVANCPENFTVYSGNDENTLTMIKHGARGSISVTANIVPAKMQALCEAALQQNYQVAEQLNQQLQLLQHKLFVETNPIPVKWVLQHMGLISPGIRLPLTPCDATHYNDLITAVQQAGAEI